MLKKVLIIDDESDIRRYLTTLLEDHDYRALAAASSQEGYTHVERELPDLICLDIMMPQESGLALYRRLAGDDRFRSIPVLLISAVSGAREFDVHEFSKGEPLPEPVGFLEKPIDPGQFIQTIRELIGP